MVRTFSIGDSGQIVVQYRARDAACGAAILDYFDTNARDALAHGDAACRSPFHSSQGCRFPTRGHERDSRYRYQPATLASDCVCQMANIASWWQRGNDQLRTTVVDDQPSNIAQFYCRNRRAAQAETASVSL
jgi:hypothetical protein